MFKRFGKNISKLLGDRNRLSMKESKSNAFMHIVIVNLNVFAINIKN